MTRRVLHDAVSLKHFAIVDRLDVLEERHGHLEEPRWCEEVHEEIKKGAGFTIEMRQLGAARYNDANATITRSVHGHGSA